MDTDKDPYAVVKGFWHAHIGWMLARRDKRKMGRADDEDLLADPVVKFQHTYYVPLFLLMSFILPTLVCGYFWGDYRGGYFVAGVARLVFVHHSTFCVNSLAHWAGDATYTDGHTARNSMITALVTLGEGYHNFHHEFPSDYRNGVEWWQYDPTKVVIYALSLVGLAYDLQTFPTNEIVKGQLQMQHKALHSRKQGVYWGPAPDALPVISKDSFRARVLAGERLLVLDGFVLDVTEFISKHPGGEKYIRMFLTPDTGEWWTTARKTAPPETDGTLTHDTPSLPPLPPLRADGDSTASFKGEVYKHSNAARNLAETLRVARIEGYWAK